VSNLKGFATLTSPVELLMKLQHDLSRMEQDLANPYPAFDFFVTAEHLLDWLYPDSAKPTNKQTRAQKRQNEPLLRVTSHLANGAKHFQTTASHHNSVDNLRVHDGAFDAEVFDPGVFDTDCLLVELQRADATVLGQQITAIELARRVLAYWQPQFALSTGSP
jgi:hypothetical protein